MPNKLLSILIKESKIIAVALFTGVFLAVIIAAYTYLYSTTTQRNIAQNVIRFHVLANSDSLADQNLKERVRHAVLEEFEEVLSANTNIEATRRLLTAKLPEMQAIAEKIIARDGYNYKVTADLTQVFFPTRVYGNMSFPPGTYESVQLVIGDGKGSNWWCLMFPPLCFVDMTATEEGRQQLENTVTEEGFRLLMHMEEESPGLTVRFRVVEWWMNREQPETNITPNMEEQTASAGYDY